MFSCNEDEEKHDDCKFQSCFIRRLHFCQRGAKCIFLRLLVQKKPFSDQITKDNEGEEMGEKIKEGVGVRIVHFFPPPIL